MKKPREAKTLSDLADLLGISRQTLWKYSRIKGFPESGKKGFDVAAVGEFIVANSKKGDLHSKDILKIMRARQLALQNELIEMKVAEARGEIVPRSEHMEKIATLARAFRRALDTIAARVSAITRDPALAETVRKECAAACQIVRDELGVASIHPSPDQEGNNPHED